MIDLESVQVNHRRSCRHRIAAGYAGLDEDQQEHGVSAKFVDIVPDGRLAFARQFFADTTDSEIEKSGDQGN